MTTYIIIASVLVELCFATGNNGCSVDYKNANVTTLSFQLDWRPPAGTPGRPGKPGVIGPVGPRGRNGIAGPVGSKGSAGERGSIGPAGAKGSRGPPGPIPVEELIQLTSELVTIKKALAPLMEGSVFISGRIYYFGLKMLNWQAARDLCKEKGGDLAFKGIRDRQTFDGIVRIIKQKGNKFYWIGLTDSAEEGRYTFLDGISAPTSSFFWQKGRPNGEGDCMRLQHKVIDVACSRTNQYRPLCEF